MRILDRYIVREIFRHAFLGLLVFTFVLFVPQLVRLMELLVRHSGSGAQIARLFLYVFPGVLIFTLPMAVLVGVLLGLGRMSADSEIIALTALGVSRQRMLVPVGVLALTGAVATGTLTLWLGPAAFRALRTIEADLLASQASFQVQPRVFDERFPKLVLYVNDVSASGTQWHGVFLAQAGEESGAQVTLAENAIVIAEPKQGKLELHLQGGTTHEVSRQDPDHYSLTDFGQSDMPIEVTGLVSPQSHALSNPERATGDLLREKGRNWREARVEFHRRLAFPFACLVFALIAVPLGSQPRRGGRAAGTVLSVLVIGLYYSLSVTGAGLSREGKLSPFLGIWLANLSLTALAVFLLPRMEHLRGDSRWLRRLTRLEIWKRLLRRRQQQARRKAAEAARAGNGEREQPRTSEGSFPRLMDIYLLRRFLSNFALLMVAFVSLLQVFTFFELLDDIARHGVPFLTVVKYFWYLTPYLLYQLTPLGALVAVLVTLGVMSKNNEIVACKAGGISLYRLALPLLLGGLTLAAAMIVFDDTYLPFANQRQDALRNQIKGKPAQTYTRPQRWIFGEKGKIYNYDLFEPDTSVFAGVTVVELEPGTFHVKRRVFASRASWSESQNTWVLESGWVRDFHDGTIQNYQKFTATTLAELSEPPTYFNREVRQAIQLSFRQLGNYIRELRNAGFDVSTLTVQWYVKIAFPLITPVSMLLAIPYAFRVGARGAIGGVAVGLGLGIAYWSLARLLEAMGGVGQMPPPFAAFAPNLIFFFVGMYFFFKMPT
jgi:LPS export ABC transporter permease LptF/LPS export ABC transporter permease LptG